MPLPWTDFLATWRKYTGLYPIEAPMGVGGSNPGPGAFSSLTTTGGRTKHVRIVTSNYTQDGNTLDEVIVCNHATTPITVTLLSPSATTGRFLTIENKGAANTTVSGTINADTAVTSMVLPKGTSVDLSSDGTAYNLT